MKDVFLMGAATAAHQVEGDNRNSDSWVLEHLEHSTYAEPSGRGADHYHRYQEDIDYLVKEGLNAYRFSIEWARVEPEKGVFSDEEYKHYEDVLDYCHSNGIIPIVTLHHFTSPIWQIKKGGWKDVSVVEDFTDYCRETVKRLGSKMSYICTINEANMGLQLAKIMEQYQKMALQGDGNLQIGLNLEEMQKGQLLYQKECEEQFGRPDVNTFLGGRTAEEEILVMQAHVAARSAMKEIKPDLKIGLTLSLYDIQVRPGGEKLAEELWNEDFGIYFSYMQEDDFIGVQNYSRKVVSSEGVIVPEGAVMTDAGYEYYPEGIANVVRKVASVWDKEIIVTENGISASDDTRRVAFIETAVKGLIECRKDGIQLSGYCHWSLLDNFEWQRGYGQRFGLISVDRDTMERTVKPSLRILGKMFQMV